MYQYVNDLSHKNYGFEINKQIENLLISDGGKIKLCDFGNCTTKIYKPDERWILQHRVL